MQSRILLIDDDDNQHLINRFILEREGFVLLSAYDGPSGLEMLLESKPDLILLDYMMPGMDGGDVLNTILTDPRYEHCRQIPVIMLTAASHDKARIQEFLEKGLSAYLKKPFGSKELVNVINNTLYTNSIRIRDRILFQAIKDSRDFLEDLLDNCPALILTTDRHGVITYCSRASQEIIGLDCRDLLGHPLLSFWKGPGEDIIALLHETESAPTVLHQEGNFVGRNGQAVPLAMSFTLLRNSKSEPTGLLAVGKDLSTFRELQKQMLEKERLLGITEALATVNHEINNPLTPIIGNVQLLLSSEKASDPSVVQKLQSIEMNARKIQEIIQQMNQLSRPLRKHYYGDTHILDLERSS